MLFQENYFRRKITDLVLTKLCLDISTMNNTVVIIITFKFRMIIVFFTKM